MGSKKALKQGQKRRIFEAIEIALILLQQNTENVVAKTQTRRYLQHRGLK